MNHKDPRFVLSAFFRRSKIFMLIFVPINLLTALYLILTPPQYESTAKILVKLGKDSVPEVTLSGSASPTLSLDEQHSLVQANLNILTSRDLVEQLLNAQTIAKVYPRIVADPPDEGTVMDAAVKKFGKDLITKIDGDSNVVDMGIYNANPAIAKELVEQLIALFIKRQSEIYNNPQTAILEAQSREASQKMEQSHKQLTDYQAQYGITSLDQELGLLLKQRNDLSEYLSSHKIDKSAPSAPGMGDLTQSIPAQNMASGNDRLPVLDNIQNKIDELTAKRAELLQTYKADSKVVKNLDENIAIETAALQQSVSALNAQIADIDRTIQEKNQQKAHFDEIARQVALDEDAYKELQARVREANAREDMNQQKITQITVVEQPTLPFKSTRPMVILVILGGLVVGVAFGLLACMLLENFDQTIGTPDEIIQKLNLPSLANFNARAKPSTEELARLVYALETKLIVNPSRLVGVASCYTADKITMFVDALSNYIGADHKKRVLLIERNAIASTKKVTRNYPSASLYEVALEHAMMRDAIEPGPSNGMGYATAYLFKNEVIPSAVEDVARLQVVLNALRKDYDFILLSLSDCLRDPFTGCLAQIVDANIFVIRAETTRLPVIKRALQVIETPKLKTLGVVLLDRRLHIPSWIYRWI